MRAVSSLICLGIVSALSGIGCIADVYLQTCQVVNVAVTSRTAGQPIEGATVRYVQRTDHPKVSSLSNEALLSAYGRVGGVTDEKGRVSFEIDTSRIAGGLFGDYNPRSDQLRGKPFVFAVSTGDYTDIISAELREGVESGGAHANLRIDRIGPAMQGDGKEKRSSERGRR